MKNRKIYLSITGGKDADWQGKLKEINKFGLKEVAVFIERFDKSQRKKLYKSLLESSIKKVPLVHFRNDAGAEEIRFFINNFKTQYFNIHESSFKYLNKWKGYWGKLLLEMNYDSKIADNVKVRKIGGFCVDLAHFKAAMVKKSEEYYYIFFRRHDIKFICNHLSGYSKKFNSDLHFAKSFEDFDYLKTLPKFVFGKIIAMEIDNTIEEQQKFSKYALKLLDGNS